MTQSAWPPGIDVIGRFHRWRMRLCVPAFRKVVADMAKMANGDFAAFDEATKQFMAGREDHARKPAIDRLLRLWFRHHRREVVRRGDEKRYIEAAAGRALMAS
jgi:hypothetical protein